MGLQAVLGGQPRLVGIPLWLLLPPHLLYATKSDVWRGSRHIIPDGKWLLTFVWREDQSCSFEFHATFYHLDNKDILLVLRIFKIFVNVFIGFRLSTLWPYWFEFSPDYLKKNRCHAFWCFSKSIWVFEYVLLTYRESQMCPKDGNITGNQQ